MHKRRTIIVDIDGTLANCDHRLHHIRSDGVDEEDSSRKTDWDAFFSACDDDQPIKPIVRLVQGLKLIGWAVILMTGRECVYREQTERWLQEHGIDYDLLLMRLLDNHDKDVNLKRNWLHMLRNGEIALPDASWPSMAIEDRKRCIDMWREEGLVALQCDEGDF